MWETSEAVHKTAVAKRPRVRELKIMLLLCRMSGIPPFLVLVSNSKLKSDKDCSSSKGRHGQSIE